MTNKVQKIREEVERMHNLLPVMDGDNISVNYADRICTTLEMYIDSMQEEPVSEDFEAKVKNLWKEINTGHNYSIVDSYNQFYGLCLDIAEWQKEQFEKDYTNLCNGIATAKGLAVSMAYDKGVTDGKEQLMAKSVDVTIAIPYQNGYGGYTQLVDSKETLPFGENLKVLVIKED